MSDTSNSRACDYKTLCGYNANGAVAPVEARSAGGVMVVPSWGSISNDSLTRGGSCGGYPTIVDAYGAGAAACATKFTSASCNSCNK